MSLRDFPVVLLLAPVLACAAGEAQWTGTVTDSAGIQIVENTGQPLWPEDRGWTVREVLRIGTVEADPDYQFGQIGWLTPASDGRIFVLDNQAQHVKVFAANGGYERTIGKPGSGPGEIGLPQGNNGFVGVGAGDTLFVPDIANQRVNRWTADGTEAGSFPLNVLGGFPIAWQMAPNGQLLEQVRHLNIGTGTGAAPTQLDLVLRLTSDGAVTDTVTAFPAGESITFTGPIPSWTIYSPETAWSSTDDGGMLMGVNNDYRIFQYNAAGTLQRIITIPYEPRLVSEADQQAVLEFFKKIFAEQPIPPSIAEQLIKNNVHFGEYLPAFAQAIGGPEGTIWVQKVNAASDMTQEQRDAANFLEDIGAPDWDVLDHEGRFLGVITMPDRFAPRVIVGDKIYGVWRDEMDVQYVVVLEIER